MFSFLDSSSYCCSGNPFQLDTNIQASNAGSGMQCGEVTLSGPRRCSLITMAHLHRQFIIIILLMKLEFHCLQIRSQHLKKKKRQKEENQCKPRSSLLLFLVPRSACRHPRCPCRGAGLAVGWGLRGSRRGPRTRQPFGGSSCPALAQFAQSHPSAPAGPRCRPLLHLESSGSLIVLLNINGLVIS